MKKLAISLWAVLVFAPMFSHAQSHDAAQRLTAAIDTMDVEHRWPAGEHVNWETGLPDGRPEKTEGRHTHCSAFAAALAKRLGVYVLRPPEHGQILLANAQYDWLSSSDARGWTRIDDALDAQRAANRGELVLAVYKSHHDNTPGHVAVVRPSGKSAASVKVEGPQIAQAGTRNYSSVSLRTGFSGHPAAWEHGEVRYFAHVVDWR